MSNVYILPRNQPQQHLVVRGRQRPLLPATTTATRVVRASSHLLGAGNHRRVLRSQPYPTSVEEKSMGRPGYRRVYLAQPNSTAYSPMIGQNPHHQPTFGRPIFTVASSSPMDQQQSEEDEFDVEEVYRLLEESAGHRMEQDAGAFPPRRRQRLTNLTAEEKMDRRKEKNRIAAQAARDRKKEMNKRLEDSLKKALLEIGRLKSEVKFLRTENAQLQMQQQPMQQYQQQPIMNVHRHQQPNPTATAIGQHVVNHCPQQQQSEESLGSAASFNEPQPWERESDNSSRSHDEQQQRQQLANNNNGIRHNNSNTRQCPLLKGEGIGQKQHKKMGMGTASNEQKLRMACMMKNCTFQSMWTASATRSLRRALLHRILAMDFTFINYFQQLTKNNNKMAQDLLDAQHLNRQFEAKFWQAFPSPHISYHLKVPSEGGYQFLYIDDFGRLKKMDENDGIGETFTFRKNAEDGTFSIYSGARFLRIPTGARGVQKELFFGEEDRNRNERNRTTSFVLERNAQNPVQHAGVLVDIYSIRNGLYISPVPNVRNKIEGEFHVRPAGKFLIVPEEVDDIE